jgi:hypothetical protein
MGDASHLSFKLTESPPRSEIINPSSRREILSIISPRMYPA